MLNKKPYKLSEETKQHIFELIKKQVKNAKHYSESPALEYLLQCREFLRLAIMAEKQERESN